LNFWFQTEATNSPLDEEIKRQLIESDSIDKLALEALAQTRAKAVYDFILAEGFDEKRIKVSPVSKEVQSAMGLIPMEFTLTVYDEQGESPAGGDDKAEGAGSEAAAPTKEATPAEAAGKL
jgi:molybdopterin-guanine dinucleotide biosynthesis protein